MDLLHGLDCVDTAVLGRLMNDVGMDSWLPGYLAISMSWYPTCCSARQLVL